MVGQRSFIVYDAGTTLIQYCVDVMCLRVNILTTWIGLPHWYGRPHERDLGRLTMNNKRDINIMLSIIDIYG